MDTLEKAKLHFQGKETKHIEVPEWGDDSGPLIIYAEPLTLNDKQKIYKKAKEGELVALAYVLMWFAKDADGEKMFTIEDKRTLLNSVDPNIVANVANQILEAKSIEELKKN